MKKLFFLLLFSAFFTPTIFAQLSGSVKGKVIDAESQESLTNVTVTVIGTSIKYLTNVDGVFILNDVPIGNQIVQISLNGYESQSFPASISENQVIDLGTILLNLDVTSRDNSGLISLTEDELNDDMGGADNISGLLQSSRDVFLNTAAFEFSSTFFRVRGLDSENGTVLINGIEMNKMYNGRPQWSNWGGLNDVLRNQELTTGLSPSDYTFGGILGTTNINVRASSYQEGGRVTYSSSNRSYTNRVIASYASGLSKRGWAYTLSASRRWGNEGYVDATFYDANSFFASIEKKLGDKHSINITGIYAPNRRGKSSPNTQEVYDLKDTKYNEYWGYQDGEKRNSRVKDVDEPIVMLNHYWNIGDKTKLNTNFGYQFGKFGNSRLDYAGGANPSPAYYQDLPSYFLADPNGPDLAGAYEVEQNFINNGQINWNRIYDANITNANTGLNAAYALYEDRSDDTQFTANTILSSELSDNITLNASVNYRNLKSENFAEIIDLFGGSGYLNVDSFDGFQFDLQNPDRIVGEGEQFKYNYNLFADVLSGYVQGVFKYNKVDFYLAASINNTEYQREGLYDNEANAGNSFGMGEKLKFNGFGGKAGFTYKITGQHLLDANAGYITKAPSLRNTFSNSRENHNVVPNISEEKILSADASYILRSPKIKARLTGYYTKIEDANEISFFYADGIQGFEETSEFIQEILQGIDKRHIGGELGIEAQVTSTIKLKGVASVGEFTYDNDPNLYLTSNDVTVELGESTLKDYKVAGGPQRAFSAGFEYRDPDYWWFGATANYFSNAYVDISPLTRSKNFYLDNDGLPFNDYDTEVARELLRQEKFDDYMLVNLIGGKSWKIKDYYIGFFASVNNILDQEYKTGGFEQGRNANFRELRDDVDNSTRVFGPKYWYGRGTTYFVNIYFRF